MHATIAPLGVVLLAASSALAQVGTAVAEKAARVRPELPAGIASARIERQATDRAALTIALRPGAAENLKLLDAQGKEVPVRRSATGALQADVDPRRGYVLTPVATERRTLTKERVEFPARYVTFTPAGGTNVGGLFLQPAVVPLTWSEAARAYATELVVGYDFDDAAERPLAAPKTVTFFAEGANARIQASTVVIERSGGSGYKRVLLSTGETERPTHFTARVGPGDELKSSVVVQREAGALTLSLPATELAGYGVGSSPLTVALLGRDGLPYSPAAPVEVQLTGRQLRPPPSVVIAAGQSSATAEVRSTGIGLGQVAAQSGPLTAALPVRVVFPTAALVAALIGGALGGTARHLRNRRRKFALLVRRMAEGVVVGVVMVGACWAGLVAVDLGAGILGTPFGAFVLAALSGYLGCVLLDRVANRTFGGVQARA